MYLFIYQIKVQFIYLFIKLARNLFIYKIKVQFIYHIKAGFIYLAYLSNKRETDDFFLSE